MNPQQWLEEYEARLADLKRKSEDLQENFTASNATVSSKGGVVTITIGPNGGLLNIELGRRAMELSAPQLTSLIMETARTAQRQAAEKVLAVFEPLGEGTEAMNMVRDAIPAESTDEDEAEEFDEVETPVEPPRAYLRTSTEPPRRRPAASEGDDENQPW